jgi:hypothetical protein
MPRLSTTVHLRAAAFAFVSGDLQGYHHVVGRTRTLTGSRNCIAEAGLRTSCGTVLEKRAV